MRTDDGRGDPAATAAPGAAGGDIESLYPFLYGGGESGVGAVLDEVRRSTEEKAAEIATLRRSVIEHEAEKLAACAAAMAQRFCDGGRLYTFGNGGSSTDAQAVATAFLHPASGRPLPALSLTTDIACVTALSNDIGFEVVFSRQIGAFGKPRDIAFALSTSGGSANVIAALEEASRRGMLTVGLAGYSGGKMAELDALDYLFVVPSSSVHRIQEAQTTIYHALQELTQSALAVNARQDAVSSGHDTASSGHDTASSPQNTAAGALKPGPGLRGISRGNADRLRGHRLRGPSRLSGEHYVWNRPAGLAPSVAPAAYP